MAGKHAATVAAVGLVATFLLVSVGQGTDQRATVTIEAGVDAADPQLAVEPTTHKGPGAPQDLEAVTGSSPGEIDLSWDPPDSDGGSAITDYHIYRSAESGGPYSEIAVVDVSVTEYTDTGLPDNSTFYYVVTAENSDGESSFSNEDGATTPSVPDPPANLTAATGDAPGEVDLDWDPPVDDGGLPVTEYVVYRSDTANGSFAQLAVLSGSATGYEDGGLQDNETYHYAVSSVNDVGEGPRSSTVAALTPRAPDRPENLTAATGDAPGEVDLDWDPPVDDGGLPVTEYIIYRSDGSGGPYSEIARTEQTEFTHEESQLGIYHFRVSAENEIGESPFSNEASAMSFPDPLSPANATLDLSTGDEGWYGGEVELRRQPATRAPPAGTPEEQAVVPNRTAPGEERSLPAGLGNVSTPEASTGETRGRTGPDALSASTEGPSTRGGAVRTSNVTVHVQWPVDETIRVPAMDVEVPSEGSDGASESAASRAVPPEGSHGFIAKAMPVTDGLEPSIRPAGEQEIGTVGVGDREENLTVPRYTVSVGGAEAGVLLDLQGEQIPVQVFIPEANATVPPGNISLVSIRLSPQLEGAQPRIDHEGEQEVATVSLGDIEETITVPRHTVTIGGSEVGVEASVNEETVPVFVYVPRQEATIPPG